MKEVEIILDRSEIEICKRATNQLNPKNNCSWFDEKRDPIKQYNQYLAGMLGELSANKVLLSVSAFEKKIQKQIDYRDYLGLVSDGGYDICLDGKKFDVKTQLRSSDNFYKYSYITGRETKNQGKYIIQAWVADESVYRIDESESISVFLVGVAPLGSYQTKIARTQSGKEYTLFYYPMASMTPIQEFISSEFVSSGSYIN